jgi:hypothetical protein
LAKVYKPWILWGSKFRQEKSREGTPSNSNTNKIRKERRVSLKNRRAEEEGRGDANLGGRDMNSGVRAD